MGSLHGFEESRIQTTPPLPAFHKKAVNLALPFTMLESQVIVVGLTCSNFDLISSPNTCLNLKGFMIKDINFNDTCAQKKISQGRLKESIGSSMIE